MLGWGEEEGILWLRVNVRGKSFVGFYIILNIILSCHKDLSKFLIVIDVVVPGVVVLGMEVGDEVVWDVVVRKKILK